jgi:hypothetical protein
MHFSMDPLNGGWKYTQMVYKNVQMSNPLKKYQAQLILFNSIYQYMLN